MFMAILCWQTQLSMVFAFSAEEAYGIPFIYWKIINLSIFLAVMFFLVRKPFSQAMLDRRSSIQSELKRAKAEKEEAENKLRELQARFDRLQEETDQIRANAEKEAQAEYARLVKQTEEEAERLRTIASREIEGATKIAKLELKKFAAEKAVEIAETIIRKELKDTDNARLVDDFAKELEGVR